MEDTSLLKIFSDFQCKTDDGQFILRVIIINTWNFILLDFSLYLHDWISIFILGFFKY